MANNITIHNNTNPDVTPYGLLLDVSVLGVQEKNI
jgi:hypothetical protein